MISQTYRLFSPRQIRIDLVDERYGQSDTFYCEKGIVEYVNDINAGKTPLGERTYSVRTERETDTIWQSSGTAGRTGRVHRLCLSVRTEKTGSNDSRRKNPYAGSKNAGRIKKCS